MGVALFFGGRGAVGQAGGEGEAEAGAPASMPRGEARPAPVSG
jgi:hypothetical protein